MSKCAKPLYRSIFLFQGFGWAQRSTIYHNPAAAISTTRQVGPQLVLQRGHSSMVGAFAFSPDGEVLATGGEDWTVKAWKVKTGEMLYSLAIDGSWHFKLALSPDSRTLAVFIRSGIAQIRDARTGTLLRTLDSGAEPGAIAFSPDDSMLACGTADGSITLWNYRTGRRLRSMKAHVGASGVGVVAFSHDGQYVASSEGEHNFGKPAIELWSVATGALINTIRPQGEIDSIAFSPDARLAALPERDGSVRIFDVESGDERSRLGSDRHPAHRLAFLADNQTLAVVTGTYGAEAPDGEVHFWDLRTGAWKGALTGMSSTHGGLAVSRNGTIVATGGQDGIAFLWDRKTLA